MIITEINGKEMIEDLFSIRDKELMNGNGNGKESTNETKNLVNSMNQLDIKEVKPKKERKPRTPKKKN